MAHEEKIPIEKNMEESNMILKDPKIKEILLLCIQPKSENDMVNILSVFADKLKELGAIPNCYDLWEYDVICLCLLHYIYENDTVSLSSIFRSLYLYVNQSQLPWLQDSGISYIKSNPDCVLKELNQITNLYADSKYEEMLLDVGLASILVGNVRLVFFLIKFGIIEFPTELNKNGKKMAEILVNRFNDSIHHPLRNIQTEESRTYIKLDELLNLMLHSGINVRRALLIFLTVVLIFEYRLYEKEEMDSELQSFNKTTKMSCERKFICLNLYIQTTSQIKVTFKDIINFIRAFLKPLLNADVLRSLIQFCMDTISKSYYYYNPRSLKDLARCRIRENLQNTLTFPEQINQLVIPVSFEKISPF